MILGTAAYMAPEQARGKPVDKRADIWSFGAVLYEMLTGKRLFQGEDMTDTLAAVLRKEPEWDRIPDKVRRLLKSCLEKDPKHRLRDIGDAWKLLEEKPASASGGKPWPWMVAAGVLVLALAVAMALGLRESRQNATAPAETYRLSVVTPETTSLLDFAISPDGHTLAFVANAEGGKQLLWVPRLDTTSAQPLPGTDGAAQPFWAPDSRSLGFFAEGKLKRVEAAGGPPANHRRFSKQPGRRVEPRRGDSACASRLHRTVSSVRRGRNRDAGNRPRSQKGELTPVAAVSSRRHAFLVLRASSQGWRRLCWFA